jgi:hypothetical protein
MRAHMEMCTHRYECTLAHKHTLTHTDMHTHTCAAETGVRWHMRRKVGCDAREGNRREVYTRCHHWTERWRCAEEGWRMQGRDNRDERRMCPCRARWVE